MISRLRLQNFRRHEAAELVFNGDAQIVLIEGRNGVGKSSILEAIVLALYGEGRHGKKNLDTLTRRGAELEGLEVELEFVVGGTIYRVVRRRDGRASTAVLFGNEVALVEGPNAVNAEITKILGMDAAGFRLAVIAQQKDIDGLASLRPAERNQMIRRLLRLDAITTARDQAQAEFRRRRDLVRALRGGDELAELRNLVAATTRTRDDAQRAREAARSAAAQIEQDLAADADVDLAYEAAQRRRARAEERLAEQRREVQRLRDVLGAEKAPPAAKAATGDISALSEELSRLEVAINQADNTNRLVEQRDVTATEIARCDERLAKVRGAQADATNAADEATPLGAELEQVARSVTELEESVKGLREQLGEATAELNNLQNSIDKAETVGGTCDTCGQDVPAAQRDAHLEQLRAARKKAEARVASIKTDGAKDLDALTKARARAEQLRTRLEELTRLALNLEPLSVEAEDLTRRLTTYRKQVERLPDSTLDTTALQAERDELRAQIKEASDASEAATERARIIERRNALTEQLAAAVERASDAESDLHRCAIPDELVARRRRRVELDEQRQSELALISHFATEIAVLDERLDNLNRQVRRAESDARKKADIETDATSLANASKLLGDVADRLAAEIRPALQGSVSAMLATISDGRFTEVRIDEDYSITVKDDGEFRPLSEVSGGEADLIALAMRLALAQVVAERHGSGGAGFLILDEPFGSQDPTRREAILTAMRQLRGVYSQIFLISHIENLEDAADSVVTVTASEDRSETEICVR